MVDANPEERIPHIVHVMGAKFCRRVKDTGYLNQSKRTRLVVKKFFCTHSNELHKFILIAFIVYFWC